MKNLGLLIGLQIIERSGKQAVIKKVSGKEYLDLLNAKLGEELQEYLESQSIEELADLVEVVYAILDDKNISLEEFELIRSKRFRREALSRRNYC